MWSVVIVLLVLAGVQLLTNWLIPHFLDLPKLKQEIIQQVRDEANVQVEFGHFDLEVTFLNGLQLELDSISILPTEVNPKTNRFDWTLGAPEASVQINYLSFLWQHERGYLEKIELKKPWLYFMGNDGVADFELTLKELVEKERPESELPAPPFGNSELILHEANVLLNAWKWGQSQQSQYYQLTLPELRLWQKRTSDAVGLDIQLALLSHENELLPTNRFEQGSKAKTLLSNELEAALKLSTVEKFDYSSLQKIQTNQPITTLASGLEFVDVDLTVPSPGQLKDQLKEAGLIHQEDQITIKPLSDSSGAHPTKLALSLEKQASLFSKKDKGWTYNLNARTSGYVLNLKQRDRELPALELESTGDIKADLSEINDIKLTYQDSWKNNLTTELKKLKLPWYKKETAELNPDWLEQSTFEGTMDSAHIEVKSFQRIKTWLPQQPWPYAKGTVKAKNLSLSGQLLHPVAQQGELSLEELSLAATPKAKPWLEQLNGHAVLRPEKLLIKNLKGEFQQGGEVRAEGLIGLKKTEKSSGQIEATNLALSPLWRLALPWLQLYAYEPGVNYEALKLTGKLDGTLRWDGKGQTIDWTGQANLQQVQASTRTDVLFGLNGLLGLRDNYLIATNSRLSANLGPELPFSFEPNVNLNTLEKGQSGPILSGQFSNWSLSNLKSWYRSLDSVFSVTPLPEEIKGLDGQAHGKFSLYSLSNGKLSPQVDLKIDKIAWASLPSLGIDLIGGELNASLSGDNFILKPSRFQTEDGVWINLKGQSNLAQGNYDIGISAYDVALNTYAKPFFQELELPEGMARPKSLSGRATINLSAQSSQFEQLPNIEGTVKLTPIELAFTDLPETLKLEATQLNFTPEGKIRTKPLKGTFGPAAFSLASDITLQPELDYSVNLKTEPLALETLRTHEQFYKALIPYYNLEVWNTQGAVQLLASSTPEKTEANVKLLNAGLYATRSKLPPIYDVTGELFYTSETGKLVIRDPLSFRLGNGFFSLSQFEFETGEDQDLTLEGYGHMTPLEFNNFYGNYFYFMPTSYAVQSDFYVNLKQHLENHDWTHPKSKQYLDVTLLVHEEDIEGLPKEELIEQNGRLVVSIDTLQSRARKLRELGLDPESLTAPHLAVTGSRNPFRKEKAEATSNDSSQNTKITASVPNELQLIQTKVQEKEEEVKVKFFVPEEKRPKNSLYPDLFGFRLPENYHPLVLLDSQIDLLKDQVSVHDTTLKLLARSEPVNIQASIRNLSQPTKLKANTKAWLENSINFADLVPYQWGKQPLLAEGLMNLDMSWQTAQADDVRKTELMLFPWTLNGSVGLKGLSSESLGLEQLTGNLVFDNNVAKLNLEEFKIPATSINLKATSDPLPQYPVEFKSGEIKGEQFYVEGFQEFTKNLTSQLVGPINEGKPPNVKWVNVQGVSQLPFALKKLPVSLDAAIFNNLLFEQYRSDLLLYSNGLLEVENMRYKLANGTVESTFRLNPSANNLMSLTLSAQNVSSNALARLLLNAPNEIFGDLSGDIFFNTQGYTETDLMMNANGTANFKIQNGRLPSVAKIETLLTAANVVRGGVLGINLGNLVRLLKPFDTNYFAELNGNFQVANGVLYTQNLLSNGENLDLHVRGGIQMDNGVGNLEVLGQMSQDVSTALGRFGQLNLRKLVKPIPLLGFIPGKSKALIDYVPGIGFVPGLGGTPSQVNSFVVDMVGPLDDPGSVKNLRWLSEDAAEAWLLPSMQKPEPVTTEQPAP